MTWIGVGLKALRCRIIHRAALAFQGALEIVHHLEGLRFDADRDRQSVVVRIGGELAGDEQPPLAFDDMAVGRDGLGRAGNEVEEDV